MYLLFQVGALKQGREVPMTQWAGAKAATEGTMKDYEYILTHQCSVIDKIIRDETWLEGERRGRFVPPSDRIVRENVCKVILCIGAQLRASATKALESAQSNSQAA
jgi:hypothetical protein